MPLERALTAISAPPRDPHRAPQRFNRVEQRRNRHLDQAHGANPAHADDPLAHDEHEERRSKQADVQQVIVRALQRGNPKPLSLERERPPFALS